MSLSIRVLLLLIVFAAAGASLSAEAVLAGRDKPSKTELRGFNQIDALLKKGKVEDAKKGIAEFKERFPDSRLVPEFTPLLRRYGVGDEVQINLLERKFFAKQEMTPESVLQRVETSIAKLAARYPNKLEALLPNHTVEVNLYESEGLYRRRTRSLNTGGHYKSLRKNFKEGRYHGSVNWFFTPGPAKERERQFEKLLYHEHAHYLNVKYFGSVLPSILEEGIAEYFETKCADGESTFNNMTPEEEVKTFARKGLRHIQDAKSFEKFLVSSRGFGKGGRTINEWYGLSFAILDFFEFGELKVKSSFPRVLEFLNEKAKKRVEPYTKRGGSKQLPARYSAKELLSELVKREYDVELETFRRALVLHIQAYKPKF